MNDDDLVQQRRLVMLLESLNGGDGAQQSLVSSVTLLRSAHSTEPVPVLYEPCIAIVAQGQKRLHLPDQVVTYDTRNYLLLTVPVPADCETLVGKKAPFLGFAVRIDLAILGDLLLELDGSYEPPTAQSHHVSALPVDASLRNVSIRLIESLHSPADAKVLGPQLVRELHYRVLRGTGGYILRDLLLSNESRTKIHRILQCLHLTYAAPLDVSALAHEAGMSTSALHLHFKKVTATSPVQYLKMIRLHKARMLMVQEAMAASLAAQRVGYGSPSQFSREFKRMFGMPPADEAQRVRATIGFTDEVSAATP